MALGTPRRPAPVYPSRERRAEMFQRILANAQWRTRGVLLIVGVVFVFAIAALLPRGQDSTSGSPTPSSTARSSASAVPTASPTAVAVASPTPEPPAATAVPTPRPAPVTADGFGRVLVGASERTGSAHYRSNHQRRGHRHDRPDGWILPLDQLRQLVAGPRAGHEHAAGSAL